MNTPRISVVMPVYNRDWCVAEAIESVLTIKEQELELIVVDDGSTDKTPKILSEYTALDPERIRVFSHPGNANRGIACSRNLGVAMSRGEYLAFLDSDDLYLPERFQHAISWLERHPQFVACVEPYCVRTIESPLVDVTVKHLTALPSENAGWLRAMLFANTYWNMPTITMRRAALAQYGRFDECLSFAEETSLWLRLASAQVVGCAQSIVPVACVRRHGQHSWDPSDRVADRGTFLYVLRNAVAWSLRRNDVADMARELLWSRLQTYIIEILSEPGLPVSLRVKGWLWSVLIFPNLLVDRRITANLLRIPFR